MHSTVSMLLEEAFSVNLFILESNTKSDHQGICERFILLGGGNVAYDDNEPEIRSWLKQADKDAVVYLLQGAIEGSKAEKLADTTPCAADTHSFSTLMHPPALRKALAGRTAYSTCINRISAAIFCSDSNILGGEAIAFASAFEQSDSQVSIVSIDSIEQGNGFGGYSKLPNSHADQCNEDGYAAGDAEAMPVDVDDTDIKEGEHNKKSDAVDTVESEEAASEPFPGDTVVEEHDHVDDDEPRPNANLDGIWISAPGDHLDRGDDNGGSRVIRVKIAPRKRKACATNVNHGNVVDYKKFRKNYVASRHAA